MSDKTTKNNQDHKQSMPVNENDMDPKPMYDKPSFKGCGRLKDKVAIITGGDSGIGRAIAVAYAKEGAKVAIVYNDSDEDAQKTKEVVESYQGEILLIKGDLRDSAFSYEIVNQTIAAFSRIDILINNAAEQHPKKSVLDISDEQLETTFKTNVFAMFYLTKAVLRHLKEGSCIINTSSITSYRGNPVLLDYSATKGAINSFTRSLAINLADKKIRVNQVVPGPIWTPLIPSTFDEESVNTFGQDTLMQRPGQPVELAESYVFLASDGASYITGQSIHVNGGEIING